jgi:general L-amino acid transport system substrate-binding protein
MPCSEGFEMKSTLVATLLCTFALLWPGTAAAGTLETTRAGGRIACGVHPGLNGFAAPDNQGKWHGFDIDFCRALAAAVLGDATKVKEVALSPKARFTALQSGEVDVLARRATWTMTRDTALGLNFAAIHYFDGQAMMVRKSLGVTSALQLAGASVCTSTGTTTELNMADFFRSNKLDYQLVAFEMPDEVVQAYDKGRCDVFTTDRSNLFAQRVKLADPDAHMVLPEIISKEPIGPVVRQGDDQWLDIVKWTHYAMVNAEELGVTSANVDEMKASQNPEIKRLLGIEGDFGASLGLDGAWAYNIIKQVGNYGETFERNLGPASPLAMSRGQNELWSRGGLIYAPPIR